MGRRCRIQEPGPGDREQEKGIRERYAAIRFPQTLHGESGNSPRSGTP